MGITCQAYSEFILLELPSYSGNPSRTSAMIRVIQNADDDDDKKVYAR